ncbi:nuclear transport factor 2 family protein [Pseudomonas aeruginosa]|uniref:nuclear transport factor 2 family protein n=1 Tax=Pseudomonas aeruginosa TaxID=287 RepID=UPI000FF09B17|nr:nuclear transport factor 2 family protein [Pseudomonas aeruginosa]RWX82479.1 nuclear transport factor 2 family protein [Pseudomonas aeruginosa]HJE37539.1 nuclear transport factor 2 family protein [Pseudomonas aeruginosa]
MSRPPIEVLDISAADERVAAFGRSTYRSRVVGKTMTSPFSILAKVRDGQIV